MEGIKAFFESDEFRTLYKNEFQPILQKMDNVKNVNIKKLRRKVWQWKIITIPFIPLAPWLLMFEYKTNTEVFHYFIRKIEHYNKLIDKEKNIIRNQYKFNIVHPCLEKSYSNVEYIVHQRFGTKSIYKSMFFEDYLLEIKGEDFMRFYFGDIMLQFSELKITFDLGKTSFRGIFLSVDFPKTFRTSCVIKLEKGKFLKNKKHKPYPLDKRNRKVLELTELEASPFEKLYKVYSEDPVETRYILSPTTMNLLVDYQKKLNLPVEYSFVDNRMYVRIKTRKNLFEPSYKENNDNMQKLKNNLAFISELTDVINDMNLDTKIWKV